MNDLPMIKSSVVLNVGPEYEQESQWEYVASELEDMLVDFGTWLPAVVAKGDGHDEVAALRDLCNEILDAE